MDILYLLIPISLIFVGLIVLVFMWAIKSGQFDDLEGPAHSIIMDEDMASSDEQDTTKSPQPSKSGT